LATALGTPFSLLVSEAGRLALGVDIED